MRAAARPCQGAPCRPFLKAVHQVDSTWKLKAVLAPYAGMGLFLLLAFLNLWIRLDGLVAVLWEICHLGCSLFVLVIRLAFGGGEILFDTACASCAVLHFVLGSAWTVICSSSSSSLVVLTSVIQTVRNTPVAVANSSEARCNLCLLAFEAITAGAVALSTTTPWDVPDWMLLCFCLL